MENAYLAKKKSKMAGKMTATNITKKHTPMLQDTRSKSSQKGRGSLLSVQNKERLMSQGEHENPA